jgi:hypothetical protein
MAALRTEPLQTGGCAQAHAFVLKGFDATLDD